VRDSSDIWQQPPEPKRSWFSDTAAICRHEWRLLVQSPLSYIFQIGFLATIAIAIFLVADFYHSDEASVRPLLTFLPWVSLIFVPALGMRSCQDADSESELTLSLPIHTSAVVMGKFLAGYGLLLVSLLFTLAFPLTVLYLGEPDPGVLICTYLAGALLLASYYAISLLASALARQQVAAFVLGLLFLFLLTIMGWSTPAQLLGDTVPNDWLDTIAAASPKTWLDSLGRGVIEAGAVSYFLALVGIALAATAVVLGGRRRNRSGLPFWTGFTLSTLVALVTVALIVPRLADLPLQIDLSAEKEYTLSPGSRELISEMPNDTAIEFYWSASESETPAHIRTHARRVKALLTQIERHANGRLKLIDVDPQPDSDAELNALSKDIQKVPMTSGDQFYLGASFSYADRVTTIPYFDLDRDRLTEYDIMVALHSLTQPVTARVALLSPLLAPRTAKENRKGLSFVSELRKSYDLAVVPYFSSELPPNLDVLILVQPVILQKEMLYAIDQFLMNGGSVIAIVDPWVRLERGVNQATFDPSTEINDLSDLLLAYGVEFEPTQIVGDQMLAAEVAKPDGSALAYPYWLRMPAGQLDNAHPVTASLNELLFVEAGELKVRPDSNIQSLISTTASSGIQHRDSFSSEPPDSLAAGFIAQDQQRVIAVSKNSDFRSAFSDSMVAAEKKKTHVKNSSQTALLFVVADTDWLFDPFSLQNVNVGEQTILRPLNDNLALLLNMIEYSSGSASLLSIRSRGQVHRPFSRVAELLAEARAEYRQQEIELTATLDRQQRLVEENLDAEPATSPSSVKLLDDQRALLPVKRQLRDIRRLMRKSVDQLGQRIVVINLIAGPLLSLLFAAWVRYRRRRRHATARVLHSP